MASQTKTQPNSGFNRRWFLGRSRRRRNASGSSARSRAEEKTRDLR